MFPIGVLLFVVYMLLFQYDRCLMEQDVGALALWGSCVEAENAEELKLMLENRVKKLYMDKYAVWKMTVFDARLEKNYFSVTGEGELTFPAPGWNFWSGEDVWKAKKICTLRRISPTEFVRLCRRVQVQQGTQKTGEENVER